ncbi:Spy0128 family protein [Enterococcus sp. AZ072]|uniref:Spy0128 family protein n=1 Tax=unclassified Enterococcus TaxID=2608891 RepID=UPI003D268438
MGKKMFRYLGLLLIMTTNVISPLTAVAQTTMEVNSHQQEKSKIDTREENYKLENDFEKIVNEDKEIPEASKQESVISSEDVENNAKSRGPTVDTAAPNVITSIRITDSFGNAINTSIGSWDSFRIYGDFTIPNNQVSVGNTTTITLPNTLTFYATESFDVKDREGNVVANAVIDSNTKTVVLTYTDFVEKNSDISGTFFFYAKVDTEIVKEKETISVDVDVDGTVINGGKLDYDGPGGKNEDPIEKSGWVDPAKSDTLNYYLAINHDQQTYANTTVKDRLDFYGAQIDISSFQILKGNWVWDNSIPSWNLENQTDVTTEYIVNLDPDDKGFTIQLGDIKKDEGFVIKYNVLLSYIPNDGEKFNNKAVLNSNKEIVSEVESQIKYQKGGGTAEGYTYAIKIQKKDGEGNALAEAEFEIVRDRTGQVVGTIISDALGNAQLKNVLKDNYTVKEIKAPDGYQLSTQELKISPADFDSNKEYNMEFINRKISSTKMNLTANKKLTGKTLNAGDFNFELKDSDGKVLQTKSNNAQGAINFDEITYDKAGTYTYTIEEVQGTQVGMTYDPHVTTVAVTVKDNNGNLEATAAYTGDQTFNNSYKPSNGAVFLTANKKLTGKTLNAGDFNFELKDSDGKVLQTKSNDAQGAINFDEITYDKAGTYTYTIEEVQGTQVGMTYDSHVITVAVTVKDNNGKLEATAAYTGDQTFNNSYKPSTTITTTQKNNNSSSGVGKSSGKLLPVTGEKKSVTLTLVGFSIVFIVVLCAIQKKYKKEN